MLQKGNGFEEFRPLAQGLAIGIAFAHGEAEEQSDLAMFEHETVGSSETVIYPAAFAGRVSASVMGPSSRLTGSANISSTVQFDLQGKSAMPGSDELTDKKIEVAEAHTDIKIARMEGKLDLVVSKIDGINSRLDDVRHDYLATRANIWVVGLGLAVLIVGVAALFPVFFGVGTQLRDIIDKAIDAHISSTTPVPPRR